MSKWGSLGVATEASSKMQIVLPGEIDPLVDKANVEAFIAFMPWDSDVGRKFDQDLQREAVRKGFRQKSRSELRAEAESVDAVREQADRLSALAVGWHLVDPETRQPIDVPFSKENAHELFMAPEMAWLRRQCWVFVANEANFMRRSSKA